MCINYRYPCAYISWHCFHSTCVSRCPPRSFPNQGGVCWPCHESCETCAGAGQDSCLTCAPAHLLVTDLAVCLQQCPEGYYESTDITSTLIAIRMKFRWLANLSEKKSVYYLPVKLNIKLGPLLLFSLLCFSFV